MNNSLLRKYSMAQKSMKKTQLLILTAILLGAITFSIIQIVRANPAKPNPGHSWNETECDTNLCVNTGTGRVGIGVVSPGYKLDVASGGSTTARLGTTGSDTVVIGGGTGKLTVGTVDPLFDIQGNKYATFLPGMTGVKEETTGVVQLTKREYIIDFDELEQGSDLWVFYHVTDFGENWNKLAVLLSAEGPGEVWYKKEPTNNQLIIYGENANSVSYRLTAPRFDWKKWLNVVEDGTVTGLAVGEAINDQYTQATSTDEQFVQNPESSLLASFGARVKQTLADFTPLDFKEIFSGLGLFIENGIARIEKLFAREIVVEKAQFKRIEMVDQVTGELWCTWIENGEWVKVKSPCSELPAIESKSAIEL